MILADKKPFAWTEREIRFYIHTAGDIHAGIGELGSALCVCVCLCEKCVDIGSDKCFLTV